MNTKVTTWNIKLPVNLATMYKTEGGNAHGGRDGGWSGIDSCHSFKVSNISKAILNVSHRQFIYAYVCLSCNIIMHLHIWFM